MSTWPSTRINLGVLTVLENCMYSMKILSSSSMLFIGSRVRVEPKEHPVKKGVPQGNLLGSLLWKIYSEDPRQHASKAVTSELVYRRDLTLGKSQKLINWRKYDRDETILFQPVTLKIMTLQISSVRAVKKPYALKDLTTKEASQKACSALTHPSLLYGHVLTPLRTLH